MPALDAYDPKGPQPLECHTLQAVVKLHETGKLDDVRKAGAKNLTLLRQLMDDLIDVHQRGKAPRAALPKSYWIGDIEGREQNNLKTLIDGGAIHATGDGSDARMAQKGSRLVFLGDIGDRGSVAMWARRVLTALVKADPSSVDIVWGNRCLAKLGLLNDLPALEEGKDPHFTAWLTKHGSANTIDSRVQYWLEGHGASEELEHHRSELESMRGQPVSLGEAATHYVESLKPGGEYFEFLRLGNWGVTPDRVDAPAMAWHGGASRDSIRGVPLDDRVPKTAREYATRWAEMGRELFAKVEQSINQTGRVPPEILSLGDSDWDERAGQNSFKSASNTYGQRDKEQGNYRGVSEAVAAFYASDGVHFEPVGHSPVPQLPMPMKSAELGGVTRIYNDTSFTSDESLAFTANVGDLFVMAGRLGDAESGEIVVWTVKPDEKSPIGLVTNDGYTVRGMTLDGEYALTRYVDGHQIANKKVSPQQLVELEPRAVSLEESEEANFGRDQWYQDLARFKYELLDTADIEDHLGDRTPIVISAASEYGKLPLSPNEIDEMWESLLKHFPSDAAGFLTGGTNVEKSWEDDRGVTRFVKAPEYVFHERARAADADMIGFVPEQTNTTDISRELGKLCVAGRKGEWDAPLLTAMGVASKANGAAIFVGGGGTITRAIDEAVAKPNLQVVLVVSKDVAEKAERARAGHDVPTFGASDSAAVELLKKGPLPPNFMLVTGSDDLGALLAARLQR